MADIFSKNAYYGYIIKGDLPGAIAYAKHHGQLELYDRFMAVFEREQYIAYDVDGDLNELLTIYQQYYRDAFYLRTGKGKAQDALRARLADFFGLRGSSAGLDDMEQNQVAEAVQCRGLHFLGGKTSGYYGPYIWKTTEAKTYEVELPDGVQTYTVKLLDGFIAKSWIDYLSFGEIGPGGWADGDGVIHCVKSAYDFGSESFKVSLLKHEAQHARDLFLQKDMPSEELEYRAKLVELIYSTERNLLTQFVQEADGADANNGHASASSKIIEGFVRELGRSRTELEALPNEEIRAVAGALFAQSAKQAQ